MNFRKQSVAFCYDTIQNWFVPLEKNNLKKELKEAVPVAYQSNCYWESRKAGQNISKTFLYSVLPSTSIHWETPNSATSTFMLMTFTGLIPHPKEYKHLNKTADRNSILWKNILPPKHQLDFISLHFGIASRLAVYSKMNLEIWREKYAMTYKAVGI